MLAALSAPAAPPPSAPAQPAPSAPSPATPTKATVVAPPKAPASPAGLASRPSRRGVPPPREQPSEPLGTEEDAFSSIKKLGRPDENDPMEDPSPAERVEPKVDEQKEAQLDEEHNEAPKKGDEKSVEEPAKLGQKKTNPWTLVETYKAKTHKLESELAELRSKATEPPKEVVEKLSAIEKRNQELEQHMQFLDYSKSKEFTDKYAKPYHDAWARATKGLKGLKLPAGTHPETGQEMVRDVTLQDIAKWANMDEGAARMEINDLFKQDSGDVKAYINKIRDLAEEQSRALEEHTAKAGEWQNQTQAQARAMQEGNSKLWKQFSDESIAKHEFLRPVEGDDERNAKLEKAAAFVTEALSAKPNDPNLTEQQRADVIKRHVALRNRAIAYSVLMHENKALKAALAEKEQALKAYGDSAPTDGEGKGKQASANGELSIDGVAALLGKLGR